MKIKRYHLFATVGKNNPKDKGYWVAYSDIEHLIDPPILEIADTEGWWWFELYGIYTPTEVQEYDTDIWQMRNSDTFDWEPILKGKWIKIHQPETCK